jgi:phosphatidylinositol alpha-1,6-mannosyltransferase
MITRNLPPLRGGMERLNAQMAKALSGEYQVIVLAPAGSRLDDAGAVRLVCCPLPGLGAFLIWAMFRSTFHAVRGRARWVLGGSGLVAPVVLLAGWASRAQRGIYLHGLDIVVRSRLYRSVWLPAVRRMHLCVVNSRNTRQLAIDAGVDVERLRIVFPGVTLAPIVPTAARRGDTDAFRERHGLGAGPLVLSVGRLTKRKGLAEFAARGMPAFLTARPDARLVVIGDEAPDALNASGVGQRGRIAAAAKAAGVEASIHFLGPVREDELHCAFLAAAVHVFPGVQVDGDVEGFGMVAIEAAAQGLPTVAFDVGGVSDAVDDPASGTLVASGDYDALVEALIEAIDHGSEARAASCRAVAERFAWPVFRQSISAALAAEGLDGR